MAKIFRKIFWGVIIATFRINIGMIPILPAFIGWIIVLDGLIDLGNNSFFEEVPSLKWTGVSLVAASMIYEGVGVLSPLSLESGYIWLFFPVIILLIEFTLFHKLFESSLYHFQKMNDKKSQQKMIKRDRFYIILMASTLLILIVSTIAYLNFLLVIGLVLNVVVRLYLIGILYLLSKISYHEIANSITFSNN